MIKAASLFSQILSTIRTAANFDNLVAKHEAILRMGGVLLFVNLPSDDAATEDVHDGFRQNVFCKRKILKKVKTFIGTSENALRIQIFSAMIALLVLKWLHYLSKSGWSFSNLASMLRLSLFTYRELRVWLDKPCDTPPLTPDLAQLRLNLS